MADVVETRYPQAGGYAVSSSDESNAGTAPSYVHARPNMIRRDTDQILSYYQSEHAGRPDPAIGLHDHFFKQEQPPQLNRHDSTASSNSSTYSTDSLAGRVARPPAEVSEPQPALHSRHTRRPSVPSQESVDRRRLAIVEVEPTLPPSISRKGSIKTSSSSNPSGVSIPSSALLLRRGLQVNGLALVAPPDASPSTYTDLTPPPTAPLFASERNGGQLSSSIGHQHSHSASETVGVPLRSYSKLTRDVGIIGMGSPQKMEDTSGGIESRSSGHASATPKDPANLQVPIFQTPTKSRSPSPASHTPELIDSTTTSFNDSLQVTPAHVLDRGSRDQARTPGIGEGKDIQQPVVGPVVVGLESDFVIRKSVLPVSSGLASPASQYTNSPSSTYLSYEPGVNATAGPLPVPPSTASDINKQPLGGPPPRPPRAIRTPLPEGASLPPPQPRRDFEALKESLQLPKSVSTVLASRSTSPLGLSREGSSSSGGKTPESSDIDASSPVTTAEAKRTRSIHRREGAFPPSDASPVTPETSPAIDLTEHIGPPRSQLPVAATSEMTTEATLTAEPDIIHEDSDHDLATQSGWKLHRENSWVSLRNEAHRASSPNGKPQASPDERSPLSTSSPLPPPKTNAGVGVPLENMRTPSSGSGSSNPFKATLHSLRRFSALPRTPSQISLRSKPASTDHSSRTPSPSFTSTPRIRATHRIVNAWPEAMTYNDVLALRSTRERSSLYAKKIKQFTMYESGLRDWIAAMHAKRSTNSRGSRSPPHAVTGSPPTAYELGEMAPIPRHVSGGSVGSEMTFPVRPDAYKATDLTMRPGDDLSSTKIPPSYLPYPSLAANPSRSPSALPQHVRTYQIPLSSGSSRSSTGFFASIGRRASMKKERALGFTPSSSPNVLTKRQATTNQPPARPLQTNHSPSIPGGPRAAPGRVARSQTISIAPAPVEHIQQQPDAPQSRRQSIGGRRNSLFRRSTTTAAMHPPPLPPSPDFERQVDKLADLLPHADRKILAAYLRRAGQDVLAIGQYLEDEKNGNLRYD